MLHRAMSGTISLSMEVELGWGMHDKRSYDHLSPGRRKETGALKTLLDRCELHNIPFAFDVVGHLLLEACDGSHPGPYPSDWWREDPGTDARQDPLFYAPDLVEAITASSVDHEICTPTFSHTLYGEMSADVFDPELAQVADLHNEWGLPTPKSIVFPRHQTNHFDVLNEHGIKTVRDTLDAYGPTAPNPLKKFHWILTRDHPMTGPRTEPGVLVTPYTPHPSLTSVLLPRGQSPTHSAFRALPVGYRKCRHLKYIESILERVAGTEGTHTSGATCTTHPMISN